MNVLLEQRDLTVEDIADVFADLSSESAADVHAHFAKNGDALKAMVTRDNGPYAWCIDLDGVPVCIYGAIDCDDHLETWCFYTPNFYRNPHGITEIMRNSIGVARAEEGRPVQVHSILLMPKAEEWLLRLGFKPTGRMYQSAMGRVVSIYERTD